MGLGEEIEFNFLTKMNSSLFLVLKNLYAVTVKWKHILGIILIELSAKF
jgi:hypothetical protein